MSVLHPGTEAFTIMRLTVFAELWLWSSLFFLERFDIQLIDWVRDTWSLLDGIVLHLNLDKDLFVKFMDVLLQQLIWNDLILVCVRIFRFQHNVNNLIDDLKC